MILCILQNSHFKFIWSSWVLLIFLLFNQQVFVSFYPIEVWSLWKICWALWSYRLYIFFLFLGFHPRTILFNLPAAALEVTSVQIYTLYHGWHIVCVSVHFKLSSECNLWFIPSVYHRLLGIVCLCNLTHIPYFSVPCTTCNYALKKARIYMTGKM